MENKRPLVFMADDEDRNIALLRAALKPFNYELRSFSNGQLLLDEVAKHGPPDLILSDVMMPVLTGFEICESIKSDKETAKTPIVLITGLDTMEDKVRGLEAGADDFLRKPFHPLELRARVKSLLRIKALNDQLEIQNELLHNEKLLLEQAVRERTVELDELNLGLVAALDGANKLNDSDTGNHIKRVCHYSELIAEGIGLDSDVCIRIGRYASLHDVGKVGIPDSILKKPGKLTPDEWDEMKRHTVYGYELLKTAKADEIAQHIALCHHEKFDGSGYPYGLSGDQIPIEARIVALADVFDALTNKRCYKAAFSNDVAEKMIKESSGSHFDPLVVETMFQHLDGIRGIQDAYKDINLPDPIDQITMDTPPPHLIARGTSTP